MNQTEVVLSKILHLLELARQENEAASEKHRIAICELKSQKRDLERILQHERDRIRESAEADRRHREDIERTAADDRRRVSSLEQELRKMRTERDQYRSWYEIVEGERRDRDVVDQLCSSETEHDLDFIEDTQDCPQCGEPQLISDGRNASCSYCNSKFLLRVP